MANIDHIVYNETEYQIADAAGRAMIAPNFDATQAYSAGQYVVYTDGKLYRLTADHAANAAWADTSKTEATVGADVGGLKDTINSDAFNMLTGASWVLGSIKTNGTTTSSNVRIRTVNYIDIGVYTRFILSVNAGYRVAVVWYAANNSCLADDYWISYRNTELAPPEGAVKLKIVVGKVVEESASTDYASEITLNGYTESGELFDNVSDDTAFLFEAGAISANNGGYAEAEARLADRRRTQMVYLPSRAVVTLKDTTNYAICVFKYSPDGKTFENATEYLDNGVYVNEWGRYIRLQAKRKDDGNFTDADHVIVNVSYKIMETHEIVRCVSDVDGRTKFIDNDQLITALAAMRQFDPTTFSKNTANNPLPTFIHVTDCHGDVECFNFAIELANAIKPAAILNTGDGVRYHGNDDLTYMAEGAKRTSIPLLPTVGNHEMRAQTEQQMYEHVIKPYEDDLTLPEETYPTYYYKDFDTEKLRVICVNQFQYNGSLVTSVTRNYTQEQITFFCDALLSTPEGYGVIVLAHTPEKKCAVSEGYEKFYQSEYPASAEDIGASISPIYDIIDAFISGTSIDETYSNASGATPSTFTADADFSEKNDDVEFIAFLCGHEHRDAIHYAPDCTNKILVLDATCTCHWTYKNRYGNDGSGYQYYAELSDLPRVEGNNSQNALNVYGIDRSRGVVRVARVGSNRTYKMELRDCMVIPYKELT